jgi:hypothetical protein
MPVKKPCVATVCLHRFQVSTRQTDVTDRMETITPRCWNDLNADAWSKVLTFVSVSELLEVRLLCRSMFQACASPATWAGRFNGSEFYGERTHKGYASFVQSVWTGRRSKGLSMSSICRQTRNVPISILKHMDRLENITIDWWYALNWKHIWINILLCNPATCQRLKTLKVEGPIIVPSNSLVVASGEAVVTNMFDRFSDSNRKQDEEESPHKSLKVHQCRQKATDTVEAVFPNLDTLSFWPSDIEGVKWMIDNAPNVVDLSFPHSVETEVFDYVWPTVRRLTIDLGSTLFDNTSNVMKRLVNWTLLESLVVSDMTNGEVVRVAEHVVLPQIKELSVSSNLMSFDTKTNGSFRSTDWPVTIFRVFPNVVRLRLAWIHFSRIKFRVKNENIALDALVLWLEGSGQYHAPLECVTVEYSHPTQEVDVAHLDSLIRCDRILRVSIVATQDTLRRWEKTSGGLWVESRDSTWADVRTWRDSIQKELPGKLSTNF